MMHHEFEELAGYEVSYDDYTNIIEPMYNATNLSKREFVKTLDRKRFELKREPKYTPIKMCVRNRCHEMKTPNGCWYYIEYVNLKEADIRTGKIVVEELPESEIEKLVSEGKNLNYDTSYDVDYTKCIDSKRKPIELKWPF